MFITDHNKIISYDPTISVIRLFSLVGCFVLFCGPVSVFVECRWLITIRIGVWWYRTWRWREVRDSSQSFLSDALQRTSSECSGDTTELVINRKADFLLYNQFGCISTSFWRCPLKSVRRKALGWISYFTPSYNHSVVATVCWNTVTSVANISSCGPQKSTVIVSFLWSTVRCLLHTDHNKKVKPPVSHAPISKEPVFKKFILS